MDGTAGPVIARALAMLGPEGTYVRYGTSAGEGEPLPLPPLYRAGGASLYGLSMFHEMKREPASVGLARLAAMMASGDLRVRVEVEAPWTEVADVARQLVDRGYAGKAMLNVA